MRRGCVAARYGSFHEEERQHENIPMNESSIFLKHTVDRRDEFKPNPRLIELIGELKPLLEPLQTRVNGQYIAPKQPVALVIGCPRSGTTLLSQVLATTGVFAYPSNVMNRFAYAPYIGARIQQMLFDPAYDYREELADIQSAVNFSSTLGRSRGALAISEFFHFWRRFLPTFDPQFIPEDQLGHIRIDAMRAELASIESAFGKPFMGKGMMMQGNISFFAERMPEVLFIYITRPPIHVMQSIYNARQKFYGTTNIWYSIKPREYGELATMDPIDQIAGQVYYIDRAIKQELESIDSARSVWLEYSQLCKNPAEIYGQVREHYRQMGNDLSTDYRGESSFNASRRLTLPKAVLDAMEAAFTRFSEDNAR